MSLIRKHVAVLQAWACLDLVDISVYYVNRCRKCTCFTVSDLLLRILEVYEAGSMTDDKVAMDFYNRRRVMRNELEDFLESGENHDTLCRLARDVSTDQLTKLLKCGESVCRIDLHDDNGTSAQGTGFHLGGGWVMTNQHVVCCKDEENSNASYMRFVFPQKTFERRPRNVIFSYFYDPEDTMPVHDSRKDLALVLVEEITRSEDVKIGALIDISAQPANEGDRVFLIHYGNGVADKQYPPQQFSVCDNEVCLSYENKSGNTISVHTAHSRPGSSGAPLLVFDEEQNKFLVAAVHYAGTESAEMIDSPGFALWYNYGDKNNDWLQDTVLLARGIGIICDLAAIDIRHRYQDISMKKELYRLQEYLCQHSLRIALKVRLPDGVDFQCDNIIFAK